MDSIAENNLNLIQFLRETLEEIGSYERRRRWAEADTAKSVLSRCIQAAKEAKAVIDDIQTENKDAEKGLMKLPEAARYYKTTKAELEGDAENLASAGLALQIAGEWRFRKF